MESKFICLYCTPYDAFSDLEVKTVLGKSYTRTSGLIHRDHMKSGILYKYCWLVVMKKRKAPANNTWVGCAGITRDDLNAEMTSSAGTGTVYRKLLLALQGQRFCLRQSHNSSASVKVPYGIYVTAWGQLKWLALALG